MFLQAHDETPMPANCLYAARRCIPLFNVNRLHTDELNGKTGWRTNSTESRCRVATGLAGRASALVTLFHYPLAIYLITLTFLGTFFTLVGIHDRKTSLLLCLKPWRRPTRTISSFDHVCLISRGDNPPLLTTTIVCLKAKRTVPHLVNTRPSDRNLVFINHAVVDECKDWRTDTLMKNADRVWLAWKRPKTICGLDAENIFPRRNNRIHLGTK